VPTQPGYAGPPHPGLPHQGGPGPYGPPGYRPGFAPRPTAPDGRPLAEFSDRLLAILIDTGILMLVAFVLAIPMTLVMFFWIINKVPTSEGGSVPDPSPWEFIWPVLIMEAVLVLALVGVRYVYDVQMMYKTGQTVGKRVMKIQVIPVRPGEPLTRRVATKRWLAGAVAPMIVPFLSYVDGLWQLWDKPLRQCLHDKYADTVVVKVAG